MKTSLLLLLFLFQPQSPQVDRLQQQVDRQQQQLDRLQQSVQGVASELDRTQQLLARELRPDCSAEVRWHPGSLRIVDQNILIPIRTSLFSLVSQPTDSCLPAEIRITATYFTQAESFVCSGSLSVSQVDVSQNTYFEIRPYDTEHFLKWRDRPTLEQSTMHRLICLDAEGIDVPYPAGEGTSMRIYATVFPRRGGLSIAEIQLNLPRLQRR